MKKFKAYILWDDAVGYNTSKIYLDEFSANIALHENFTDYYIKNKKAKIESIDVVSYKEEEKYEI